MSNYERWIKDVRITVHVENDGPSVLRKGLEPVDTEMSLEEAVRKYGAEWVRREIEEILKWPSK